MKLIRLTEITKKGDGTKTQPMLLNPDIIASVSTGELKNDGPHIIGQTTLDAVTFILFKNNSGTFVEETLERIAELVSDPIDILPGTILGKN